VDDRVLKLLKQLAKKSNLYNWKKLVEDLLKDRKTHGRLLDSDIGAAVELILSSNQFQFFKFLHDTDLNTKGLVFQGTIHCEASLTSLLHHSTASTTDDTCKAIHAQLEVCYTISNWCMSLNLYFLLLYFRVMDELLEYRNVAAQHVIISSPS
jgi:hypothetical protein